HAEYGKHRPAWVLADCGAVSLRRATSGPSGPAPDNRLDLGRQCGAHADSAHERAIRASRTQPPILFRHHAIADAADVAGWASSAGATGLGRVRRPGRRAGRPRGPLAHVA